MRLCTALVAAAAATSHALAALPSEATAASTAAPPPPNEEAWGAAAAAPGRLLRTIAALSRAAARCLLPLGAYCWMHATAGCMPLLDACHCWVHAASVHAASGAC